ncbi:uncharacterized protein At1g51745 [Lactuca sativa]|uniref:uncharacterized protein At1g51745 n=1 Tax=Lactuca sativa TaxID=4236 RepID=UPI000CD838DC|nr:uncharacterized protein At1g51745 [Lactuca sativa]
MGSSCEANGKNIDPTVGGLVWVRRRNGSWWPGRILGPDELPESCLVSPRLGTPVKLLGRDDASVDWYNLEKSKRVKSFRCGEYDECIEKAKASAVVPSKKAVKYARREDAILHALEIESSRLPKKSPQQSDTKHLHPDQDQDQDEEETTEAMSDKLSGLEYISNSPPELELELELTPNDSEDDGNEGSKKRMRGLEDIGISGAFKRRRSQVAHVHEFLKKKNRRRQLTKVLETTAMVTVPVMCEQLTGSGSFLPENKVSGSFSVVINNNNNSDSSNNDVSLSPTDSKQKDKENGSSSISGLLDNDSSARLFDVPFIGEEKETKAMVSEKLQSGQSSLVDTAPVGPNEIQESGSINSGGTSKWQHKGKRNSRNKSKTIHKFLDPDVTHVCKVKSEQITESLPVEEATATATAPHRSLPYRQSRFTVNPKYESSSDVGFRKQDSGSLYDVNIEVNSGHHPQHVPYISLMSKLTGQPITGHPLLVEVLNGNESLSDLELNSSECHSSSCELGAVNGVVNNGDVRMALEARVSGNGKSPGKAKRNGNGILSNKKIRRLSSLTGSKRPANETGKFKKPGEACVPLKVVFGRINTALGR